MLNLSKPGKEKTRLICSDGF